MSKNTKTLLWVGIIAVAAYLGYRWYKNKQASAAGAAATSAPLSTSSAGSNLNSVAPELIGGGDAAGTTVQPVLTVPVTVSIDQTSQNPPAQPQTPVIGVNATTPSGVTAQSTAAGSTGASSTGSTGASSTGSTGASSTGSSSTGSTGSTGSTAPGHATEYAGNVEQIAKRNGMTLTQFLAANPSLAKYKGTGTVLPKGTRINT